MSRTPAPATSLDEDDFDTLRDVVNDAADRLGDAQILELADDLHEVLRSRRRLRGRVHDRIDNRLCSRVTDLRIQRFSRPAAGGS